MSADKTNIDTPTPGVEAKEDTVAVTLDVPVDVLATIAGGDELATEQSMRAALQYWADMDAHNRAEMAREQSQQIRGGDTR
jgi:hypothetical protein